MTMCTHTGLRLLQIGKYVKMREITIIHFGIPTASAAFLHRGLAGVSTLVHAIFVKSWQQLQPSVV